MLKEYCLTLDEPIMSLFTHQLEQVASDDNLIKSSSGIPSSGKGRVSHQG